MPVRTISSFVRGEWRDGPRTLEDINPGRPTEVLAEVAAADRQIADEAAGAADAAFRHWRSVPAPDRGAILQQAAHLLAERATVLGVELAKEEGKTVPEGIAEVRGAAVQLQYAGGMASQPDGETFSSQSNTTSLLYARREPLGVVLCITPWNFPIALPAAKLGHALAHGNTVVWKPAELTPITALGLLDALLEAGLPADVLQVVIGTGAEVGATLVEHEGVRAISFTGSNQVGATIRQQAAQRRKSVQLELGGKNPAIVLADADLDFAAEQIVAGAYLSAGQKCTATSRVIAEQSIAAELGERIVERIRNLRVGDQLDPRTNVGPLASQGQLQRVRRYLGLANQDGTALIGGDAAPPEPDDGYFVQPALYTGLSATHPVACEEIFGPVAVLLPVPSARAALDAANATPFGLSASLFTQSLRHAHWFAAQLEVGVVKINQPTTGNEAHVPFGGYKDSSSGTREMGRAARDFYTQWKTVYLNPGSPPGFE